MLQQSHVHSNISTHQHFKNALKFTSFMLQLKATINNIIIIIIT